LKAVELGARIFSATTRTPVEMSECTYFNIKPVQAIKEKAMAEPTLVEAASVILLKREGGTLNTFWLRRAQNLRMAGGFYAFPGGKVDAEDASAPAEGCAQGLHRFCVAALRELFEETGVLLAKNVEAVDKPTLEAFREALMKRQVGFAEEVQRLGLHLDASSLTPAGVWVTPPFFPRRFYSQFFLALCPEGASPQVRAEEAEEGHWVSPGEALRLWEEGVALLHPPALHILRCLAGFRTEAQLVYELRNPPFCREHIGQHLEFQRGVFLLPLQSHTLPPFQYTNTYILGTGDLWVVDPGFSEEAGREYCLRVLTELKAMGKTPRGILLTHAHADHVEGAPWLREQCRLPIACHALTAKQLPFPVERLLEDGEVLHLGGPLPMRLEVLHTPGHAPGHLCLWEARRSILLAGDMVAGQGTIAISPIDGDMADYVAQLERLLALDPHVLHPAHGPTLPDGTGKLQSYLRHRAVRERQLLALLEQGESDEEALCEGVYAPLDPQMRPWAQGSLRALLLKLEKEGKVVSEAPHWYLA